MTRRRALIPLDAVGVVFTACDQPTAPELNPPDDAVSILAKKDKITPNRWDCVDPEDPRCVPGEDPNPNAPGVYLAVQGQPMTPEWCEENGTDSDHDGIDDYCEYRLAYNFRPEMVYWRYDGGVEGEPYYAVQRVTADYPDNIDTYDPYPFRIMYLLAYYEDYGSGCYWWIPPPWSQCYWGHRGDSEFVVVDVVYDADSQHWTLQAARGSAHYLGFTNRTIYLPPADLEFPDRYGWYPRYYVSVDKHANYESRDVCNSAGVDECLAPAETFRPVVTLTNNIGSKPFPAADIPFNVLGNQWTCVQSRDDYRRQYLGFDRLECFWRPDYFFGGWRDDTTTVLDYHAILMDHGFGQTGPGY